MSDTLNQIQDSLATLKANGDHHFDPVRYEHICTLTGKASSAREGIQGKLYEKALSLLDCYQSDLKANEENACRLPRRSQTRIFLKDLHQTLNDRNRRQNNDKPSDAITERLLEKEDSTLIEAGFDTLNKQPNELQAYTLYRESKKQFETDTLVDAIIKNPETYGPLNPQKLLIRSLESMRELSPHYLNRFVGYIDTLVRLEEGERIIRDQPTESSD
ncbi:MAG: DUF2894 domain-containing protein [Pseudomonadales bacterium]